MINAYHQQLSLESYAQEALAGSWMELVNGPDPFPEPDFLQDPALSYQDGNFAGDEHFLDDCSECGGARPPIFNIPPPPPPPAYEEDDQESSTDIPHLIYVGDKRRLDSGGRKNTVDWKGQSVSSKKNCEESLLPQDICPAFLVAGDAHVRPRLQPPIAALIIAVTTFAFVITIAAIVCWRYRRHKNRGDSSKSTNDLSNGVIYEDLPSGPTPRGLTTHGHDTRTLAPMELLDLKLANQIHNSSYPGSETLQRSLLNQYSTSSVISPSNVIYPKFPNPPYSQDSAAPKDLNLYKNSQKTLFIDYSFRPNADELTYKDYPYSTNNQDSLSANGEFLYNAKDYPYGLDNHKVLATNPYSPKVLTTTSEIIYHGESTPHELDNENSHNSFLNRYQNLLTESQHPTKKTSFKGSQDIYNPTYEEVSTGSESTSVTSGSSAGRRPVAPSPQGGDVPLVLQEGPWPTAPCPCNSNKRICSTAPRRGNRIRRQKALVEESAYHEHLIEPLTSPPIPAPALYTIAGTSDGRTSTSSSSDHPPDRGCGVREARYYVGSPKDECCPYLVTQAPSYHIRTCTPQKDNRLPPLPSRSDRYRIFFTTDKRRSNSGQDFKTLELSRKRNKDKDKQLSVESEPLYHEL